MVTRDAVLVVPGIMGSELVDSETGQVVWGLADPRWYARAWTSGSQLAALRLTDDERVGRFGRVRATRLLKFPAFAPLLQGLEPYSALLKALRSEVVHPAAVAEFPYDWRLPVSHNASLLAVAADRHLSAWRQHPAHNAAHRIDPDDSVARLVIVAHSMGGLLAWALALLPGAADSLRTIVTLGTPFYGAPKAVVLLSSGRGAPLPLPRARLRRVAIGLPGVYDLLPVYRCVDAGDSARSLTPEDITSLGGDRELAAASWTWRATLDRTIPEGHLQVVGAHQPTIQSISIADGVAEGHRYTCRAHSVTGVHRIDLLGDGTVPRDSAQLSGTIALPLAQSHGALARSSDAILVACDAVSARRTGPWLGGSELGIDTPDVAAAGVQFAVAIGGVDHPRHAFCQVTDVATGRRVAAPAFRRENERIVATVPGLGPGLYRVEVTGGGGSAVSQLTLVAQY